MARPNGPGNGCDECVNAGSASYNLVPERQRFIRMLLPGDHLLRAFSARVMPCQTLPARWAGLTLGAFGIRRLWRFALGAFGADLSLSGFRVSVTAHHARRLHTYPVKQPPHSGWPMIILARRRPPCRPIDR